MPSCYLPPSPAPRLLLDPFAAHTETCLLFILRAARSPDLPSPAPLSAQLCRGYTSGKMDKSEFDVNVEQGFVKRQHAPLQPALAAVASA